METPSQTITLSAEITKEHLANCGLAIHNGKLVLSVHRANSYDSGIGHDEDADTTMGSGSGNIHATEDLMDVDRDGEYMVPHHTPDCLTKRYINHLLEQIHEQTDHVASLQADMARICTEARERVLAAQAERDANAVANAEVGQLRAENLSLKNHIEEMQAEAAQLQPRFAQLEEAASEADCLRTQLVDRTEKVTEQARRIQLLEQENSELSTENDDLNLAMEMGTPSYSYPSMCSYCPIVLKYIHAPLLPSGLCREWTGEAHEPPQEESSVDNFPPQSVSERVALLKFALPAQYHRSRVPNSLE